MSYKPKASTSLDKNLRVFFTKEIGNSLGVTITWYKNSFRKISCKGVICYASDTECLGER